VVTTKHAVRAHLRHRHPHVRAQLVPQPALLGGDGQVLQRQALWLEPRQAQPF
jgi:hypothetical protein